MQSVRPQRCTSQMCPECGGVESAGLLTAEDTWEQAGDGTRPGQKGLRPKQRTPPACAVQQDISVQGPG